MKLFLWSAFNLTELIHGIINSSSILLEQNDISVTFDESEPMDAWGDEFQGGRGCDELSEQRDPIMQNLIRRSESGIQEKTVLSG